MLDQGKHEVTRPGEQDWMSCPMCGATIAVASPKCPACGEALAVSQTPRTWPARLFTLLVLFGIGAVLVALVLPAVWRSAGPAARRAQCMNNLKQIALALCNYEAEYHALPPAYTVDAEGKPLHSWRTLIIPYLDQQPLYAKIDRSKPWDDPANAEARDTVVPVFNCPSGVGPKNHTTYLASVGSNACFRPTQARLVSEITDGQSQTLMVIEVPSNRSIPWMSPHDADEALVLSIGAECKLDHVGGVHAALCDGSIRFLSTA